MSIFSLFKKKVREPYKKVDLTESDFIKRQVMFVKRIRFENSLYEFSQSNIVAINQMKIEAMEGFFGLC